MCGQPLEAAMAAAVAGPPILALDAVSTTYISNAGQLPAVLSERYNLLTVQTDSL